MPRTHGSSRQALFASSALAAMLLLAIVWGHEGRRVGQMALLAAPGVLWLLWPLRSTWMHRLRCLGVWLWALAFVLDGVARAYLQQAYQAAPDGALVLGAMANTNAREGSEYLSTQWRSMLGWAAAVAVAALLTPLFARLGARRQGAGLATYSAASPYSTGLSAGWSAPRWAIAGACLLALAIGLGYASKPWRRLHPVTFWTHWAQAVETQRAGWANAQSSRDRALQRAKTIAPTITQAGPATVVLVITDSINRDNMGLYGYGRSTTPALLALKAELGAEMAVLKNAWSVDASTLPSLRNMFNFGQAESQDPLHVLALARAAGYKTWWISNHDDLGIEQQHGRMADVIDMVNRTPGRAGTSLDSELLDCVQEALQDTTDRKLIVVHLMGAHPHYNLRYPEGANPFNAQNDAVETKLERDGRSAWVRKFRREYDAAVLYHDSIVAELFELTRDTPHVGPTESYRAWMYLSDHGQEVGHDSNRAGHSPATPSGYRIPTIIWQNQLAKPRPTDIEDRPFRADWTAWALVDLLNIHWSGDEYTRSVLDEGYRWQDPALPAKVTSFNQ